MSQNYKKIVDSLPRDEWIRNITQWVHDEMVDKLDELMELVPEEMRGEIQRFKSKVEQMR